MEWREERGGVNLFPIIIYSVETDTSIRLYTTYIVSLLSRGATLSLDHLALKTLRFIGFLARGF